MMAAPKTLPANFDQWDDAPPSSTDIALGLGKAAGSGLVQGTESLLGTGGDVREMAAQATAWLSTKLGRPATQEEVSSFLQSSLPLGLGRLPTQKDISGVVHQIQDSFLPAGAEKGSAGYIDQYEPKNTAEKILQTGASFVPAVMGGEATLMTRAAQQGIKRTGKEVAGSLASNTAKFAAAPAIGSEFGGEAAAGLFGEEARPYGEAAGAVAGGGVGVLAGKRGNIDKNIFEAGGGNVDNQTMDMATQLMDDASAIGVKLTWPEAIAQVNKGTNLPGLQRFVESHHKSAPTMNQFMSKRPDQVEGAISKWNKEFSKPRPGQSAMSPYQVGSEAADLAEKTIRNQTKQIDDYTRKFYDIDKGKRATPFMMKKLEREVPGFREAITAIRNDPALNSYVKNLPDDSVAMLDEVKKHLGRLADEAVHPMNQAQNLQRNEAYKLGAAKVRDAAIHVAGGKKSAYATALKKQSELRDKDLRPLQEGPVGAISASKTTKQAVDAALPMSPLPGSEEAVGTAFSRLSRFKDRGTVARNLVTQRTGKEANEAFRPMDKEFAGARYRNRLYGDEQVKKNLRSAISHIPGSDRALRGLDRMMDVLEATGQRQRKGSMTTFNTEMAEELPKNKVVEAITLSRQKLVERYENWKLGKNTQELARIITDPKAGDLLRRMLKVDPRSDAAKFLAIEFGNRYLAPSEAQPAQ